MTQYFFFDESGDPGLDGGAGSSSHFVVTMVQLAHRTPLTPLIQVRKAYGFSDTSEFKYYKTAAAPRELFFSEVLSIRFRVRAAVVNKRRLLLSWRHLSARELVSELIIQMTFRASELRYDRESLHKNATGDNSEGNCDNSFAF